MSTYNLRTLSRVALLFSFSIAPFLRASTQSEIQEKIQQILDNTDDDFPTLKSSSYAEALVNPAFNEVLEKMKVLVNELADVNYKIKGLPKNENAYTLTEWVAAYGDIALFEVLEKKGGDYSGNKDGGFPLYWAVINKNEATTNKLLDMAFVKNLKGEKFDDIIESAVQTKNITLLKKLQTFPQFEIFREKVKNMNLLDLAVERRDSETFIWIMENIKPFEHLSYERLSVSFRKILNLDQMDQSREYLIRKDKRLLSIIDEADYAGNTPLFFAGRESFDFLIRNHADMTHLNKKKQSFLHAAVDSGAAYKMRILLEQSSLDPNTTDIDGHSAVGNALDMLPPLFKTRDLKDKATLFSFIYDLTAHVMSKNEFKESLQYSHPQIRGPLGCNYIICAELLVENLIKRAKLDQSDETVLSLRAMEQSNLLLHVIADLQIAQELRMENYTIQGKLILTGKNKDKVPFIASFIDTQVSVLETLAVRALEKKTSSENNEGNLAHWLIQFRLSRMALTPPKLWPLALDIIYLDRVLSDLKIKSPFFAEVAEDFENDELSTNEIKEKASQFMDKMLN